MKSTNPSSRTVAETPLLFEQKPLAKMKTWITRTLPILLLIGPAILILGLVMIYPIIMAFVMSVTELNLGTFEATWQGFAQFAQLFS